MLPVRELAVGAAAINTLWQIGAFLSPYAWGVLKDGTGHFLAGLISASLLQLAAAGLILYVRSRVVIPERQSRMTAWAQAVL